MKPWLETAADGKEIGRDPRKMTPTDFETIGISRVPLLSAVRAKCLDCCVGSPSEVRACVARTCPLWPYRMGENPFHRRELSEDARRAATEKLQKYMASAKKSPDCVE